MGCGPAARAEASAMLESPDGRIGVQLTLPTPGSAETPRWSAAFRGKAILHDCRLSLEAQGEGDLLAGVRARSERRRSADSRVKVLFGRAAAARDRYREARFTLENPQHRRIEVVFRCYDDAIAFRY